MLTSKELFGELMMIRRLAFTLMEHCPKRHCLSKVIMCRREFFRSGRFLSTVNGIVVTLVPKVRSPLKEGILGRQSAVAGDLLMFTKGDETMHVQLLMSHLLQF